MQISKEWSRILNDMKGVMVSSNNLETIQFV